MKVLETTWKKMGKGILMCLLLMLMASQVFAQTPGKGISFQAFIKSPSGNAVTTTGVTVNAKILSSNGCILREETFSNVDIVNGYLGIIVTKGTVSGSNPGLTTQKIFNNNAGTITGLICLNADGSVNNAVTSYNPTSSDVRKLRITTTIGGDKVAADFNLRSVPFSLNSESLNGKVDTDFVNINSSQSLTQTNVESIFNRFTKLDAILNSFNSGGTTAGFSISGSAANVTGTVAIANGGTGATTLAGAKSALGIGTVAAIDLPSPVDATKVLKGDGTWGTLSSGGAVSSVAGKTGAVTLTSSDVSGLGPLATMTTSGSPNGTKFLRDDGAWTTVSTTDATKLPLAGGTMTGSLNMGSQDITAVNNLAAANVSAGAGAFTNLKIYDGSANYLTQNYPTGGTSYTVKWPASVGSANQVLQINSISGNVATLGWATGASSGVSSVAAAGTAGNPLIVGGTSSAPTVDIPAATASENGYLKSTDWTTFNGKQSGSTELSAVAGLALTGIVQRTGSGTYTALGTTAPINVTGGNIGISIGAGLTTNAGSIVPDFATTSTAGKVVQANDARLPSSACAAGSKMRWNGSAWLCETDYADPSGSAVIAVANGGTGTSSGSITGTGALTFAAGGTNQNVTLTPSGTGYTVLNGNVNVSGGIRTNFVAKTTDYTIASTDSIITTGTSAGAVTTDLTFTLPSATGIAGRLYTIKKTDGSAHSVMVTTMGGQTIDGSSTLRLQSQYGYLTLVSDGANWNIVGGTGSNVAFSGSGTSADPWIWTGYTPVSCNAIRTGGSTNPAGATWSSSSGTGQDGVYKITISGTPMNVYCDMTSQGGGWTLDFAQWRVTDGTSIFSAASDLTKGDITALINGSSASAGSGGSYKMRNLYNSSPSNLWTAMLGNEWLIKADSNTIYIPTTTSVSTNSSNSTSIAVNGVNVTLNGSGVSLNNIIIGDPGGNSTVNIGRNYSYGDIASYDNRSSLSNSTAVGTTVTYGCGTGGSSTCYGRQTWLLMFYR